MSSSEDLLTEFVCGYPAADIPDNVKDGLEIIPVENVSQVLGRALVRQPEPIEWDEADEVDAIDRPTRRGLAAGVLTFFAVGCPVCNKIALLALGYSGAITWFAPVQPYLALAALALTGVALLWRLRGPVACPGAAPAAPFAFVASWSDMGCSSSGVQVRRGLSHAGRGYFPRPLASGRSAACQAPMPPSST